MDRWTFVAAAYALVFSVLLVYWRRVERGIRDHLRSQREAPAKGSR
jgi:hypothetical protein